MPTKNDTLLYTRYSGKNKRRVFPVFLWSSGKGKAYYQDHTGQHKIILMLCVIKALVCGLIRIYT